MTPLHQQLHSPGGHQVVVVEHLDKGLDLGPLGDLLLAHGGGHFAGIAVDAGHQSVAVGPVGGAVINVLLVRGGDGKVRTRQHHNKNTSVVVPAVAPGLCYTKESEAFLVGLV